MNSSVFLRIKDYILVEFVYSNALIYPSKFKKYVNSSSGRVYLSNDGKVNVPNGENDTNNIDRLMAMDSNAGYMAVVDTNEGFYYPNSNPNINVMELPTSQGIRYDSVKIHIRSGYNFQDSKGFYSDIFIKSVDGSKISLSSQAFFKGDLSNIKYNNTPLRISEMTFDKYVEYKVMSVSEILRKGSHTQAYFNDNILPEGMTSNSPIIYFDFSFIDKVDSDSGYTKFYTSSLDSLAIPASDGYDKLEPYIKEKGSYFEYMATWDSKSIEEFISIMNSRAGNKYHVEHEISVYEQRGYDFFEIHRHNTVQTFGYDKPKKFRPVVSNDVDGSIQIQYVVNLFNAGDNTSIVKRTMINSTNVNQYTEEPLRISVNPSAPLKVYNKVVRNNIAMDDPKFLEPQKVIIPIYYSNVSLSVGDSNFIMEIVPFDNVYMLYVNKEENGQSRPEKLEQSLNYQLVFPLDSGNIVRVSENNTSGKLNGVLSYKISQEQAMILLNSQNSGLFYINSVNDIAETNLLVGNWEKKGLRPDPIIDPILDEETIIDNEEPIVTEDIIQHIPDIPNLKDRLAVDRLAVINPEDVPRYNISKIEKADKLASDKVKVSLKDMAVLRKTSILTNKFKKNE